MSSRSDSKSAKLQSSYSTALKKYLAKTPGTTLRAAEKLGREAATAGISTSALATLHKNTLTSLVPSGTTERVTRNKITRASTFFVAALKPMDKTDGAKQTPHGRLTRLNEATRRGALELDRTRRKLERESARRKMLEVALKESKRKHAQLMRTSARAKKQLRHLSHQVLSAQEEERKRISRELHDEIGQILTAVNVKLATLTAQANLNAKVLKQTIRSTQRLVMRSMDKVHTFARDLRPPMLDDLGLIPALKALLDDFTEQTDTVVRFKVFAMVEKLRSDKRTVLYRVAQEAVANVAAHARASQLTVEIRRDRSIVRMDIRDDGIGFDVNRVLGSRRVSRLGLLGMRERVDMVGGSFDIESEPGNGTIIHAQIPFEGRGKPPLARRPVLSK